MSATVTPMLTVKVLCFAQLRDRIGASELTLSLPNHATGSDMCRLLAARHPAAAELLGVSRLAVNGEYAPTDCALREGDEVVVITPVSGG